MIGQFVTYPRTSRLRVISCGFVNEPDVKASLKLGDDLWRHQKKKVRLTDPSDDGTVGLLDPRPNGLSECLLTLYTKCDKADKKSNRPSGWRENALAYYKAQENVNAAPPGVWCHISGQWHPDGSIKPAHIVPFFLDNEEIGEMLFGSRSQSLNRPGNALLLNEFIEGWFNKYLLVVVPWDPREMPIKRWRTDIISSGIENFLYATGHYGKELHGKGLTFLNENRPVPRFLGFHFIMVLVRIKDVRRRGWEDVWAKYYQQRPFPTPGNHMRRSLLLAVANHFGTAEMTVVESWIHDHGFDAPLQFTDDEATEVAPRVHVAVEAAVCRAEKKTDREEDPEYYSD
ncbi:hypothetical protein F4861DRAFT_521266 [Xylaria intraflava]|nr:hypothetical protein F4861DRAFT_521266 [Xylaria intraflava]